MQQDNPSEAALKNNQIFKELRLFLKITSNWMAIPLFLLFWLADFIYIPEFKVEFLLIRMCIIPICLLIQQVALRIRDYNKLQMLTVFYATSLASLINLMVFLIGDAKTYYYAGLNLVTMGCLSFLPLTWRYFSLSTIGIYLPYALVISYLAKDINDLKVVLVNSFFIIGTLVMSLLIRFFHERLRDQEIYAKLELKNTILKRDEVIQQKTKEAVHLNSLSRQFSPQIIQAISEGRVNIDSGVRRTKICAIFIDIVDSTERVVRLDQNKVDLVLSRFLDTTISTLLKYDLTIDKFQGDGILAFANEPVQRVDFIERTCLAALEIRENLFADKEFYILHWKKELQVRMGVSQGFANVGFYGNKKFFKTYTAIGAPLPFASRLTSLANPNEILIDSDIAEVLQAQNFEIKNLGSKVIKGFEADQNFVFSLISSPLSSRIRNLTTSRVCVNHPDSVLVVDVNSKGHYVLKCRFCDFEDSTEFLPSAGFN